MASDHRPPHPVSPHPDDLDGGGRPVVGPDEARRRIAGHSGPDARPLIRPDARTPGVFRALLGLTVASAVLYAASILRRGPVTLAISSAGRAPALCRMLRQLLETLLPAPDEMTRWVTQAEALRRTWRKEKVPMRSRYEKLLETLYQDARAEAAP